MKEKEPRRPTPRLPERVIALKGAGELASAVAHRLHRSGLQRLFLLETESPLAVRRGVCFSEAIHDGRKTVEGITAIRATTPSACRRLWERGDLAVLVDPLWKSLRELQPDVVIDAIMAKRNLGTSLAEAPLVIALGPGFTAGREVHCVIETNRGHNLGRIIASGNAEPDTGIPGEIAGITAERLLRAPTDGPFAALARIGDFVVAGQVVGQVGDTPVTAPIGGVLRGLIRPQTPVTRGLKIGDVDPRGDASACVTLSDKARAVAGSVLEAILQVYNR